MTTDERLAEWVMAFWRGEHAATVAWLETLGCRLWGREGGTYVLDGPAGVRVGLPYPPGDPTTVAVLIGFLLYGGHWPQICAGAVALVNRRWGEERRRAKEAARP